MNPIAIYYGSTLLYWSAIIISAGLLASLVLSLTLQRENGDKLSGMLLLGCLSIIFSVPICRIIHWYCHLEQYEGLISALTDYSTGSYCLPGAFLGVWLASLAVKALGFQRNNAKLLDAYAPGAALTVAFIRLSALFNSSCRGKIFVKTRLLQRLPIASGLLNSVGDMEYRFACFFIEFLLMLLVAWWTLRFFYKRRNIPMKRGSVEGSTARYFLLLCCTVELLLDSSRYDSSFMKFNGFVSIVQMACALCILGLLIYYSINSTKANGTHAYHWIIWVGYFLTLAGVGISEYLVQRHGNWYLSCYTLMTVCCILMPVTVYRMYLSCCDEDN